MSDDPTKILSWNVNGLRACATKGFTRWLGRCGAEIVGVQEVRASDEQLPKTLAAPKRWQTAFNPAERKGYSGVGLFMRRAPDRIDSKLHKAKFDREGRVQLARFGRLVVANVYFPNGNGKDRDNSRVPFKLEFYRTLFAELERIRRGGARVLVMGDFNTAHREIDLARPKANRKTSGFLPKECAELDRWFEAGWTDTFRHFEPGTGHYSWWSQRFGVRKKNIGWRLDMVLASPAAMKFVRSAAIYPKVMGSDHCPVGVEVDPKIFG
ncbi:MAG: exodeoxyribonuclease III [Myxococcota bacterium]|jgi:exodeoxyribonuclease-3